MISESTAYALMVYALVIGAGIGVALAFIIDFCVGFITFHHIHRLVERTRYAWAIHGHSKRYPDMHKNRMFGGGDLEFQDYEKKERKKV